MAERKYLKDKKGIVYPITSKEAVIGLVDEINKLNDSIKALLGVDITYFLGREEAMSLFEQKKDNFEFTDSDDIKWDTSDASKPKAMLQNDVANKITRALLKPENAVDYGRVVYIDTNKTDQGFLQVRGNPYSNSLMWRDGNGISQIKSLTPSDVDNNAIPNAIVNNNLLKNYVATKTLLKPTDTANYNRIPVIDSNGSQNMYRFTSANVGGSAVGRDAAGRTLLSSVSASDVDDTSNNDYVVNNRLLREYVAAKAFTKPTKATSYYRVPTIVADSLNQDYFNASAEEFENTLIIRDSTGQTKVESPSYTGVDLNKNSKYVPNFGVLKAYVTAKSFAKPDSTTTVDRIPVINANTTDQSYLNVTSIATKGTVVRRTAAGYIQIAAPVSTNVDDDNYQFYVPNYGILKDYVEAKTTPINDSITSLNDRFITLDGTSTSLTIGNYLVMRTFDIIDNDVITYEDDTSTPKSVNIEGDYLKEMTSMTIIDTDWGGIWLTNSQGLNKIVTGNVRNIKYTNPGNSRTILIKIS